jgi:hypothetical protein
MKMPVANLEENGAQIQTGAEGFTLTLASGYRLGIAFQNPPDPASFVSDDVREVPKPSWIVQGAMGALAALDKAMHAVKNDQRLSEFGREERLEPAKEKALATLGFVLNDLQTHEAKVGEDEARRYAVPPAPGIAGNFGSELRENEIRSQLRAKSPEEQRALFQNLNDGSADPSLVLAVLHSPVSFGLLEDVAKNGWIKNVDDRDPVGLERLNLEKQSIEWAKRSLMILRTETIRKLGYQREQLFAKVHAKDLAHVFGFQPDELVRLERKQRVRQAG